ncbi:MAG: hypothetical protein C5B59_04310 [Bacteroidetes bacterium]|nr:MAG: hypothetical protein C5B59_04310 [Bacteroidota bacterium]
MRKITLAALLFIGISQTLSAQLQTSDGEGNTQAAYFKKLNKKAKYGATLINKELSFGTGKGINGFPVVTAQEDGQVEMVAIENRSTVGYVLPYNQFVKLRDYDFYVYYKTGFKSQKYPPTKISLTDESIFMDDNYGMLYGFEAAESGQRCRFKYDYLYTDAKYLTRFFFHEGFPVRETSISFKVPSWLELEIKEMNFVTYKIRKEIKKDKNFTIYTYTAENLPAIHQEPASLARPFYLPHLVITIKTFVVDQEKYNGFKSLDDLYAWYNYLYRKADNHPDVIKDQVNTLIQNKKSDEETIKALYYWVQDNIRYVAFEEGYSGFVPQTIQEVYQNKYGDCKGMANLLTEMLKIAGFDAHFAWIGTREIPYDCTQIQSMCVDNHAICVLYLKGKTYFLDGTEKYAALGRDAYRIQGKKVLVQNGETYKVEQVPVPNLEENKILTQAQLRLNGDKIMGHVSVTFKGASNNFFHYVYNSIPANKRKEFTNRIIELNSNNTEVSNVKTSDFTNRDIPITLEGDVEISNQVTLVDSLCYTNIDFFPTSITSFIPDADRENPIDIDNVLIVEDAVTLEIPAKAKVKFMPPPFQNGFNKITMDASYKAEGNKIILNKKMQLNSPVIYATEFSDWKTFLNKIREFNRKNLTIQL